jgi:rubrerythrin
MSRHGDDAGANRVHFGPSRKETTMNIFDCAIKMEQEATVCYGELAKTAAVPELKNLFTLLQAAEQEHHDSLVRMKEGNDSSLARFDVVQEAMCIFQSLLAKRDLMTAVKTELDAYDQIIRAEEEGVKFYEELAGRATANGDREILLMIADEERKHLSIVANIYAFVESPKNFLASGEFSNLKTY